jgi:hypothetical protein
MAEVFKMLHHVDTEVYEFSYPTIAGIIKLPVQIDIAHELPTKVTDKFCAVNHIHDKDISSKLAEGLGDFVITILRSRLNRAQTEMHMMQTVYGANKTTDNYKGANAYSNATIKKLEEENNRLKMLVSGKGAGEGNLGDTLLLLSQQVEEEREKANKATEKLKNFQEQLGTTTSIEQIMQKIANLQSALTEKENVTHSLKLENERVLRKFEASQREVQTLQTQMDTAMDTMSDSALSFKVQKLEEELALAHARIFEEKNSRSRLERNEKKRHSVTHREVAQWAIQRRHGNTYRGNLTLGTMHSKQPLSGSSSLIELRNLLSETKWSLDDRHWKNISKQDFLSPSVYDLSRSGSAREIPRPEFIERALRDLRWYNSRESWRSKVSGMSAERLVELVANFASDLEEMHTIVEKQESIIQRHSDMPRSNQLKLSNASEEFISEFNNSLHKVTGYSATEDDHNSEGWRSWAKEKFDLKNRLIHVESSFKAEIQKERKETEQLSDEIAIEIFKLLTLWQQDREYSSHMSPSFSS